MFGQLSGCLRYLSLKRITAHQCAMFGCEYIPFKSSRNATFIYKTLSQSLTVLALYQECDLNNIGNDLCASAYNYNNPAVRCCVTKHVVSKRPN